MEDTHFPNTLQKLSFGGHLVQSLEEIPLPSTLGTFTPAMGFKQTLGDLAAQHPQTLKCAFKFNRSLEGVQLRGEVYDCTSRPEMLAAVLSHNGQAHAHVQRKDGLSSVDKAFFGIPAKDNETHSVFLAILGATEKMAKHGTRIEQAKAQRVEAKRARRAALAETNVLRN